MAGDSENRRTERTPPNILRFGSENHIIAKCPKPPKGNEKRQKKVHFIEQINCACNNGKNESDKKIYAFMTSMSGNDEYPSGYFG